MTEAMKIVKEEQDIDGSNNSHDNKTVRYLRSFPPVHFTVRIRNFSILSSSNMGKYKSSEFTVGGQKWRLCVYPKGNKKNNVNDHISLYLSTVPERSLKFGWEVHAMFKIFLYDHICDNYLTIKDADEEPKRFHQMRTKYGFDRLVSVATFKEPCSGYLRRDCCVFGAEVFVMQPPTGKGECLLTNNLSAHNTYSMMLYYPDLRDYYHEYDVFGIGNCKWRLGIHPKGQFPYKDKFISFFLHLTKSENVPTVRKVYAEYKLRIKDRVKSFEKSANNFFVEGGAGCGYPDFLSLNDLRSMSNNLTFEVEITLTSVCSDLNK